MSNTIERPRIIYPEPAPTSVEDKLKEFDSVPLFMRTLPEEDTDDAAISALQSLAYEGTPDEIAQNFKEQGNDYYKGKRYREAMGFYTQGIEAKPTDNVLVEALLCNRAMCNLELKNYGTVLKDCSRALKLNIKSAKAYYRSALALMALDRPAEALDACNRCLSFDAENNSMRTLMDRAMQSKEKKERIERERFEEMRRKRDGARRMKFALEERNLIVIKSDSPSNPYEPHFDPEDDKNLIIPAFFLYPQHATSDLISHFSEITLFEEQLSEMFPPIAPAPDWDTNGEYVIGNLNIYAMTHKNRLLKVGKKMTLRDVYIASKGKDSERDGLEVKDGCLTFVILPRGQAEQDWITEFKTQRSPNTNYT